MRSQAFWLGIAVAATALVVGVFTNLVTGESPMWWVRVGFGLGALASIAVGAWAAVSANMKEQDVARTRRDEVLPPFTGRAADSGQHTVSGQPTVVSLLDPLAGLSPFRGQSATLTELRVWCQGPGGDRVRVLDGPSGVGKTRLARELGRSLGEAGWAAGVVKVSRRGDVVAAVSACPEPTLIVVDDADMVADVGELVDELLRHDGVPLVRLLLIVRDGAAFGRLLADRGPMSAAREFECTTVGVAGGEGDRRRWFEEALAAFREELEREKLRKEPDQRFAPLRVGTVGAAGEVMMVTCARAALAALDGGDAAAIERVRLADSEEVATQLLVLERRRWVEFAADPRWHLGGRVVTDAALSEVMLALVLAGPNDLDQAMVVVARLKGMGGHPESVYRAIVEWAEQVYPPSDPSGPRLVEPRPEYLAAALVALCVGPAYGHVVDAALEPAQSEIVPREIGPEVLVGVIRSAGWFPRAAELLGSVLGRRPELVVPAIRAAALAGLSARIAVRAQLHTAIIGIEMADNVLQDLVQVTDLPGLRRLRASLLRQVVEHARRAVDTVDDPAAHTPTSPAP